MDWDEWDGNKDLKQNNEESDKKSNKKKKKKKKDEEDEVQDPDFEVFYIIR